MKESTAAGYLVLWKLAAILMIVFAVGCKKRPTAAVECADKGGRIVTGDCHVRFECTTYRRYDTFVTSCGLVNRCAESCSYSAERAP